jgi:hypothetical protein
MDISQKVDPIRSRPVFIRLTPDLYEWVMQLTDQTGHSFANIVRVILQGARDQGVSIIAAEPVPMSLPRRRRHRKRRAVQHVSDEPQAATA